MTTPVETVTSTTTTKATAKTRKPAVKRDFNELGKFFAKIRIDLGMTTSEWAKALGVSQLAITNVERGDNKLSFDLALSIAKLIQEKAPQYEGEFAGVVAKELNVLVIPAHSSDEDINYAYTILMKGLPKVEPVTEYAPTE